MAKTRKSSDSNPAHTKTIALAFTGASGMPYGVRLLQQPRALLLLGPQQPLGDRQTLLQDAGEGGGV